MIHDVTLRGNTFVLCCENDRVPFHSVLETVAGLSLIAQLKRLRL